MRFIILGAIIVVHLVILGFLMGPCKPQPQAAQPDAETEEVESGQEEEQQEPAETTGSPRRFSASFYTETLQPLPAALEADSKDCKAGIVVDWTARAVLWKRNDTVARPIASLTKMMTVLLTMESLRQDPELTLQTPVRVTKQAYDISERQVWLDPRETFTIDDLLKATLIRSANDTAYLLGQFLAGGDEIAFVKRMNSRARKLGLAHFSFHTASGLPIHGKENEGCARELSYLAGRLLEYPEVLKWSGTEHATLTSPLRENPFRLDSTNHLLGKVRGVNGMKTGFTNAAEHCLAATCERDGRVVIVVVTGCSTNPGRDALVTGLLEWAYKGN